MSRPKGNVSQPFKNKLIVLRIIIQFLNNCVGIIFCGCIFEGWEGVLHFFLVNINKFVFLNIVNIFFNCQAVYLLFIIIMCLVYFCKQCRNEYIFFEEVRVNPLELSYGSWSNITVLIVYSIYIIYNIT